METGVVVMLALTCGQLKSAEKAWAMPREGLALEVEMVPAYYALFACFAGLVFVVLMRHPFLVVAVAATADLAGYYAWTTAVELWCVFQYQLDLVLDERFDALSDFAFAEPELLVAAARRAPCFACFVASLATAAGYVELVLEPVAFEPVEAELLEPGLATAFAEVVAGIGTDTGASYA